MTCTEASGCCARHPHVCGWNVSRMHGSLPANERHEPQPPPLRRGGSCAHYNPDSRYICDGGADFASRAEFDATQPAEVFAGRSAYFVGDSMSLQHMHAFACALRADLPSGDLTAQLKRFASNASRVGDSVCFTRRDGRRGRVCHITAGTEYTGWSVGEACRALPGFLAAQDMVIANEGLWWRAFSRPGEDRDHEIRRVHELNAETVRGIRAAGASLLWRETTAQHFDKTPTGQYKSGCKVRCGECRPVQNPQPLLERNREINHYVRGLDVSVLETFNASLAMWYEHVGRRSQVLPKDLLDCTHFCAPARIFADLTLRILALVGRGEREADATSAEARDGPRGGARPRESRVTRTLLRPNFSTADS